MLAGRTREGARDLEMTAIKNDSCVILSAGREAVSATDQTQDWSSNSARPTFSKSESLQDPEESETGIFERQPLEVIVMNSS